MSTQIWSFSPSTPQALMKELLPLLWFPPVWQLHHWKCCCDDAHFCCLLKGILSAIRANNFPVVINLKLWVIILHSKLRQKGVWIPHVWHGLKLYSGLMIPSINLSGGLAVAFPGSSTSPMFEMPFLVCFVTGLVKSNANVPVLNILHLVL